MEYDHRKRCPARFIWSVGKRDRLGRPEEGSLGGSDADWTYMVENVVWKARGRPPRDVLSEYELANRKRGNGCYARVESTRAVCLLLWDLIVRDAMYHPSRPGTYWDK